MDEKVINSLQFNNILSFISSYCVLPSAKDEVFKIHARSLRLNIFLFFFGGRIL